MKAFMKHGWQYGYGHRIADDNGREALSSSLVSGKKNPRISAPHTTTRRTHIADRMRYLNPIFITAILHIARHCCSKWIWRGAETARTCPMSAATNEVFNTHTHTVQSW